MGLDNIAPLDRSTLPPEVGTLEQADSTGWMASYAIDLLEIALRLAREDDVYEDVAVKFGEQFLRIAGSANNSGMWDDEDAYFYDILHLADGRDVPLKVRSLVGLVPVVASLAYDDPGVRTIPEFRRILSQYLEKHPELGAAFHRREIDGEQVYLLALVSPERLTRILKQVFNPEGLLSDHGIRGVSAYHREHPFTVTVDGVEASVNYEPAESTSGLFGGNSNWRGPVWFPLNALFIASLAALRIARRDGRSHRGSARVGHIADARRSGRRPLAPADLALPSRPRRTTPVGCPLSAAVDRSALEGQRVLLRILRRRHRSGPRALRTRPAGRRWSPTSSSPGTDKWIRGRSSNFARESPQGPGPVEGEVPDITRSQLQGKPLPRRCGTAPRPNTLNSSPEYPESPTVGGSGNVFGLVGGASFWRFDFSFHGLTPRIPGRRFVAANKRSRRVHTFPVSRETTAVSGRHGGQC